MSNKTRTEEECFNCANMKKAFCSENQASLEDILESCDDTAEHEQCPCFKQRKIN